MLQFNSMSRLSLELEAQSPMIHFQSREPGATIRASEVKPKLDRFLLSKLKKQTDSDGDTLHGDPRYRDIFLSDKGGKKSVALNYKMQIFCSNAPFVVVINNNQRLVERKSKAYKDLPNYSIYYGNISEYKEEEQRLGVVSDPTVVIHCFVPELRKLLSKYLEEFFLVTNFGTMQNKGFGSFAPKGLVKNASLSEDDKIRIAGYLRSMSGTGLCLEMSAKPRLVSSLSCADISRDFSNQFECIEHFYKLMKSGYNNYDTDEYERSFLFQYMHDLGVGNEKAWMKQKGISPVVYTSIDPPSSPIGNEPARYVRAFLGAFGNIRYQDGSDQQFDIKVRFNKRANNGNIVLDRVPSPVFFKIIGDTVFITAFPVPDALYGKPFIFEGYKRDVISVPERSLFKDGRFDIADFLRQYASHYNKLIENDVLPSYLENAPEVHEI